MELRKPVFFSKANPESPAGPRLLRRILIAAAVSSIAAALIFVYWFLFMRGYVGTDDAYIDGYRLELGSKILGRITRLAVEEGDSVWPGRIVAWIDSSELVAQRHEAISNQSASRKALAMSSAVLAYTQAEFQRALYQYENGVLSKEQFDLARKDLRTAQAQEALDSAQLSAATARIALIESSLQYVMVSAVCSGIVAKRWVFPGDIVQPGEQIYTVYRLTDLWVTVNLEETKSAKVCPGAPVGISVDAYHGVRFRGRVFMNGVTTASEFSLIPPNNASGNFTKVTQRVILKTTIEPVPDTGKSGRRIRLLPGMSVEVKIDVRRNGRERR